MHLQYAPYALAEGEWDERRCAALADLVVELLSQHAPEISGAVVERSVLTPRALEDLHGYPEGQPYHAELGLDQVLWMRPVPELARYRTPIAGSLSVRAGDASGRRHRGRCGSPRSENYSEASRVCGAVTRVDEMAFSSANSARRVVAARLLRFRG